VDGFFQRAARLASVYSLPLQAARICRVKYQDKVDEIEGPNFLAGGVRYSQIGRKADEEF